MLDSKTEEVQKKNGHPASRKPRRSRPLSSARARLLLEMSAEVSSFETLDEQLQALIAVAKEAIGADRGSLFLRDDMTGELYTRVADGNLRREIRLPPDTGIAGHVFTTGVAEIVPDARSHPHFNKAVDAETGYSTRDILCVPVRTMRGKIMGVAQMLNKHEGRFNESDRELLEALTRHAAIILHSSTMIEVAQRRREQESELLDVVSEVSTEIKLGPLLQKIIETVTKMLNAERSTLFLNDERSGQLYTEIGQGLGATRIRFPNHVGIAGAVFTSARSINIPHAYADLRFNPTFDRQTGFFTRSILCVPVHNKDGKVIGVTQVLNKKGGSFTEEDEARLRAFTAQIAIALENAKLFDDVQTIKNYNEAMLESMSNGVITFGEGQKIVTCNAAAQHMLHAAVADLVGRPAPEVFADGNAWVVAMLERVDDSRKADIAMDAELTVGGDKLSVNLTALPLLDHKQEPMGSMLLVEDISAEKRVKATMSRYMDPALADKLLAAGEEILGGVASEATVLFSDIRSFTTLTEEIGPQGTVALLNEYFTLMVECIQREGGMLDKFIGDAIMAVFGTPLAHEDDEDRAVRASIAMLRELDRYNRDRVAKGKKPIDIGVGVNTDNIVSGNIGSPKRMDYTVIGDGVNLASRLEGACKQYHSRMLISERTCRKLHGSYRTREVDLVIVKGKTEPVAIHEVMDYHTDESFPNLLDVLGRFGRGVKRYRARDFKGARRDFSEALNYNPHDFLSKLYVERCDTLIAAPPPDTWDGVFTMKTK